VAVLGADLPLYMQPNFPFHVVGVSHHTASVETRERFAVGAAEAVTLLDRFRRASRSALLLSTCNRFELYWWGEEDGQRWFQDLVLSRGVTSLPELTRYRGVEAVRHLFRVSAGLDSQIVGETEILGQVRRAYDAARAAGTTTPEMDLILSAALCAGRRVRRETVLGRHPGSVSSAAVSQALSQMPGSQAPEVVVLGAGEAAEGVLRALHVSHC
jgi:glutamyl-tRNA reductase